MPLLECKGIEVSRGMEGRKKGGGSREREREENKRSTK